MQKVCTKCAQSVDMIIKLIYNKCCQVVKHTKTTNKKRFLKIKYEMNVLKKEKQSAVQSTLNLNQRMENVLGTYGVRNSKKIFDKKIILVDDVYTTGATTNECSKVLKESGAREIIVVTIAHGKFD